MNIIEIFEQAGLSPCKVASTNGVELASPCPICGGKDRCRIWPQKGETGRWWCRQCQKSGDAIDALMQITGRNFAQCYVDFHTSNGMTEQQPLLALVEKGMAGAAVKFLKAHRGMDTAEARDFLNVRPDDLGPYKSAFPTVSSLRAPSKQKLFKPRESKTPDDTWQDNARSFLAWAQKQLWNTTEGESARNWLHDRGLTDETIKATGLGWNPTDFYRRRKDWGLPEKIKKNGRPKKLWLPGGMVIPYVISGKIIRLRVRRPDPGKLGRYILISGSDTRPMVWNNNDNYHIIVESELDGILINQEARGIISTIALGSISTRPDKDLHVQLQTAKLILSALDTDEPGAKTSWDWWAEHYSNVKRWPCPIGKDPGEAFQAGLNIRSWVEAGIPQSFDNQMIEAIQAEDEKSHDETLINRICEATESTENPKNIETPYHYADSKSMPLPDSCPIILGDMSLLAESACRFELGLLQRFIDENVINLESGCPFTKLCRLMSVWPRAELLDSSHSNSPQVGRSDSGDSSPQEDGRPATSFCPARDQSTNLCYHNARFNGRSCGNNGNPCDPSRCPQKVESWKKIMEESLNENTDH